jgi:hypothetical protein
MRRTRRPSMAIVDSIVGHCLDLLTIDRHMSYAKPKHQAHPQDSSIMTYRGHAVLGTLIRCHFSPDVSTGQNYIYSGR